MATFTDVHDSHDHTGIPGVGGGGGGGVFSGASVFHSSAQSLNNGSETTLVFNSEEYDTDAFHDTGSNTNRLTIPADGYYVVTAQVAFTSSTNGALRSVRIYAVTSGPTTTLVGIESVPDAATAHTIAVPLTTRPLSLVTGDYLECRVFVDGASLEALSTSAWTPRFSIYRVG
jgi:hypothetical protein